METKSWPDLPPAVLDPFQGYLELSMYEDAEKELERFSVELRVHPRVQLARLDFCIETENWSEGATLATSLGDEWPSANKFYFRCAYRLHELKQTAEARATLVNGPRALRQHAVFFYNLACYEAQLGNILEAKKQLGIAFRKDKAFKAVALDDADLKPVWDSIAT